MPLYSPQHPDGTSDAKYSCMNAILHAKLRHILIREFYRRGGLTWDMKMALKSALAGR